MFWTNISRPKICLKRILCCCCPSLWYRRHLSLSFTCQIFHLTRDLKASSHTFTFYHQAIQTVNKKDNELYPQYSYGFSSLNWPSALLDMLNDIRDVWEAQSSHHPFVGVFPDQLTLIIGELPDSQGWYTQINDLRNSVTQMPVGLGLEEPGPETQIRNTIN